MKVELWMGNDGEVDTSAYCAALAEKAKAIMTDIDNIDLPNLRNLRSLLKAVNGLWGCSEFNQFVWMSSWGHPTQITTIKEIEGWHITESGHVVSWGWLGMADSDCAVLCYPASSAITTMTAKPIKVRI